MVPTVEIHTDKAKGATRKSESSKRGSSFRFETFTNNARHTKPKAATNRLNGFVNWSRSCIRLNANKMEPTPNVTVMNPNRSNFLSGFLAGFSKWRTDMTSPSNPVGTFARNNHRQWK